MPVIALGTASHIELYDRRAGTRIADATFTSVARCASERDAAETSAPNETAIRAWVASNLAR